MTKAPGPVPARFGRGLSMIGKLEASTFKRPQGRERKPASRERGVRLAGTSVQLTSPLVVVASDFGRWVEDADALDGCRIGSNPEVPPEPLGAAGNSTEAI